MSYSAAARRLPRVLRRQIVHFECSIEEAVAGFAGSLDPGSRVLDAGAGEGQYRRCFSKQSYVGIDLAVGDASWNYSGLDALADLRALPFADASFDAAIHIVTLEHVREPLRVLSELSRVLKPGAPLLAVVPQEWEVHQSPHDYFRYTRHGMEFLLSSAGFSGIQISAVGGFFRLLSRRLLNAVRFFPTLLVPLAALVFGPPALLLPLFEPLDREKNFTLGYICVARKP